MAATFSHHCFGTAVPQHKSPNINMSASLLYNGSSIGTTHNEFGISVLRIGWVRKQRLTAHCALYLQICLSRLFSLLLHAVINFKQQCLETGEQDYMIGMLQFHPARGCTCEVNQLTNQRCPWQHDDNSDHDELIQITHPERCQSGTTDDYQFSSGTDDWLAKDRKLHPKQISAWFYSEFSCCILEL